MSHGSYYLLGHVVTPVSRMFGWSLTSPLFNGSLLPKPEDLPCRSRDGVFREFKSAFFIKVVC